MSMKKPQLGMSARKTVGNTVYHIFMVTLSVIMIYPYVWSLLSSFKSRCCPLISLRSIRCFCPSRCLFA